MTTARIETRFASFLEGHRPDPRARNRLLVSATVASIALLAAGVFGWTAEKLGVRAVAAPTTHHAISIDLAPPPPPATAPPKQPAGSSNGGAPDSAPPEPRAATPRDPSPSDAGDDPPMESNARSDGPVGKGPFNPFDGPGGQGPACAVPPCGGSTIGTPFGDRTVRPPDETRKPAIQPVEVVKANSIYTPDPSNKDLARTKAALLRSTPKGVSSVSFCVDPSGITSDVKTVKRFPGDPEVDAICRATVAKWRFRAFLVDGKPRKTCTTTAFQIEFE